MWGLPGGLPGADQHPAHVDWPAGAATPSVLPPALQEKGRLADPWLGRAGLSPVANGAARRPGGPAAVRQGRLAAPLARTWGGLDGGPRFPGPGGPVVPRTVEGTV